MVHGFGFKGLVRFAPDVDSFLVGKKQFDFMKLREDIKFDKLKVVAVDDEGVRTWDAEFYVCGSSLTGDSRHSVISHLLGTFAYLKSKNISVRFGVHGFLPKKIKFSVDPKWAPGVKFVVGGSIDNNEEFTVVSNDGPTYTVAEWVNVEKPFKGHLWDFEYFSGKVCIINSGVIVSTAEIGDADMLAKEPTGLFGYALAKGVKNSSELLKSVLELPRLSVAERFVARVSFLMGGR